MTINKTFVAVALAALLTTSVLTTSHAQRGRRGGGFGGGQGGPGGPGGFGGPGGGGFGGFRTNPNATQGDPTRIDLLGLIYRNDVRTELMVTAQQREAIDALKTSSQADLQKSMQDMRTQMRQSRGQQAPGAAAAPTDPNAPQDPNAAQNGRTAQRQQMQEQMQTIMTASTENIDKKLNSILSPAQMWRLHELDLRWRGPLALTNAGLAEYFKLTSEQRAGIKAQLDDYRKAEQTSRQAMFAGMRGGRGGRGGQQPGATPADPNQAPPTPEELKAKADQAQKDLDATRKADEAKAIALLTPAQQKTWMTLLGRPFTFRIVD